MDELTRLREEIDRLDNEVVRLLNERARVAMKVGDVKNKIGIDSFYSPERERHIFERLEKSNPGPFPTTALLAVYREILSGSLSLERPLPVAYLGPQATFTHEAAVRAFGSSTRFIACSEIKDVFSAVERGDAEYGVVPVENSTEGVVTYTLDVFIESGLKIYSEILLDVSHNLLSVSGKPENVKKIFSHPQGTAQCKQWLAKHMPRVPVVEVTSTALAAEMAAQDPEAAAIASEPAAKRYNLAFVNRKIQDLSNNITRFLVISTRTPQRTGKDKTSILCSIKDRVGGLLGILTPFYDRGLNLSSIQSRPSKRRAWEYIFFMEVIGHVDDSDLAQALEKVQQQCLFLKILGSYPSADVTED